MVDVTTTAVAGGTPDRLHKTTQQMAKLRVEGFPRNYELFHEALFGHNATLAKDVFSLGPHPSQAALDQLGLKHRLVSHCGLVEEKSQSDAVRILHGLTEQISLGVLHKHTFARALETILRSMREDENRGLAELFAEIDFLQSSAAELLRSESDLGQKLKTGIQQIEAADRAAKAARALALRDRLTGLPNRIAFSNRIEALYSGDRNTADTALIMVEIDQFRSINEQYGKDAGNRILKRLAAIFRKTIKKNDFVARLGGAEFAFVFGGVNREAAYAIAERLHAAAVNNLVFATGDGANNGTLTLSIGFALCDDAETSAQFLAQTEKALATARDNPRSPIIGFMPVRGRPSGRRAA